MPSASQSPNSPISQSDNFSTSPTFAALISAYVEAAAVERLKSGRPGAMTVRNTLSGVRLFRAYLATREPPPGSEPGEPVAAALSARDLRHYLATMLARGIRPVSALSFVAQLRQLFARWVRPYYEDRGWRFAAFPNLGTAGHAPRYRRPSEELLAKVKSWYAALGEGMGGDAAKTALWYVATMMLEFAMRNGDVKRLTRANFVTAGERVFLNYTPHKTSHSSGRLVKWPVHPDIWRELSRLRPWERPLGQGVFVRLNAEMRALGFRGTKGAYELRKICIDHVYQRFGAEMAVSLSGDEIRTITRYYADPAQPNLGNIRISELL